MTEPADKINRMDSSPGWVVVAAVGIIAGIWLAVMLTIAVVLALSLGIWNLIEAF